jgi:hypothetical protein
MPNEVPQILEKKDMPTARKLIAGLALALTAVSCSQDKSPTAPSDQSPPTAAPAVAGRADLLRNITASGPLFTEDAAGVLTATGNSVSGTLSITGMHLNQTTHKLEVNGTFTYINPKDGTTVVQTFENVAATLTGQGGPTQPTCSILTLDLGPLHLDLLGLVVDLAPVHLNITAQSGPGNLLGNLLCAVTHLLDQNPLSAALTNLLNQITTILQGL